ncbi:glycosyltransferase family 2 protein [Mucilaginibacter corticis]|uniref:Glycosyltransferase family 2 protein n=1 Tax=Mucilaginibacter corticis TaxID=2597670 RepID=A0A556MLE3_9SPHI|nr:glycosyltransferase [Mucilaginibacter corticis]TSJ40747.1 glycosyltransferase family 2 protein [Mucilaginibacter corticis]
MSVLLIVFLIIQLLVVFYLIFPFLLYVIAGIRGEEKLKADSVNDEADYAIIVTAYEQTTLLPSVVDSILKLNYSNYLIYIVADNCDITDLKFTDPRVHVLRPEEVLASNIRSHFYAINNFKRPHDRLTIIDSDNLVNAEYLNEINKLFSEGYSAVQGVRQAKNLNTTYACLDEAGDIYYRYIDRKLLFSAGSSASLAGSGMAFTLDIYRECLEQLSMGGAGFDKILQYEILKRKLRIAFAEKAVVFDEKTAKSDQLVKQRARWINTWFKFSFLGLKMNLNSIFTFNWNQFIFSLMLMRPPLFMLVLASGLFFLVDIFVIPAMLITWIVAVIIFVAIFYKAQGYFKASDSIYKSLRQVPKFVFFQVLALTKANKANQLSVATKHEDQSTINDIKN